MRMLKYRLHPGMNTFKCETNKVLMLRYLNDQDGKLTGWFEEHTVEHSDAFEYEVYLALTGEEIPDDYHWVCSHQLHTGGGYFVVHAYD